MRGCSKESSGVPLDSNLWTKPEPGSTKNTLPNQSAVIATGELSLPGPLPLSPHAPRNSKGGGCCGTGAGSVRFPHDMVQNAMSSAIDSRGHLLGEIKLEIRTVSELGIALSPAE